MLNLFRKKPRQVLTRGQLLEKLWDIDERFVDEHTPVSYTHLDVYKRQVVDRKGRGLLFTADAAKPMFFSALPYTCLLYTSRCV